jgi:DnaK suppressor protein
MTPIQLADFEKQLLHQRSELAAISETATKAADTVELDQTRVGRLSRMDALQAQAMSVENQRRRALLLKNIAAALFRIKEDEYGYCLECGEDIAINRLQVDPSTPLCINCANKLEINNGR